MKRDQPGAVLGQQQTAMIRRPFFWIIAGVICAFAVAPLIGNNVELRESLLLAAVYITLASNLNLMLGYAGYINFGSIVFFGLGGYICVDLINAHGWPLAAAELAAGVVVSILALLFGLGILRLRGAFFALATIGVNEGIEAFVSNFEPWGGSAGLYLPTTIFAPLGGPMRALWVIYFLLVVVMGASLYLSYAVKTSKFGLGLIAIGQNEDAAIILGVPTSLYKALAYSLSAFLPAIAGGLYFFKSAFIQPSDAFDLGLSTEAMVIVMLGGRGTVTGAAIGAYLYEELRGFLLTSQNFSNFQLVISGVLLLIIVLFVPGGLMGWVYARMTTPILEIRDLNKNFGGLRAVRELSFTVCEGEIFGLIGPNGAGKSTVFNLINGVVAPDRGQIRFRGVDITGRAPNHVARSGLARAHQIVQPLADLTVLDNCTVGACFGRENLPLGRARAAAREAAVFVGLEDRLAMPAAQLTIAAKKRLELARALAARPLLLLLDEVLAGLNPTEIERMVKVIREIRDRGIAILIIEHVMQAIMGLSDRIVVLNSGQKLAEGAPAEIANNPAVIEAYLGDPSLAAALQKDA
jgi:branched-chain amino acid transport system permease protein